MPETTVTGILPARWSEEYHGETGMTDSDYIDPRDSTRVEGWNAMPLKSLDAHNAEKVAAYKLANAPRPNGIACPECGKELVDTDATVKSAPFWRVMPYVVIHCPACDYYGERVA